MRTALNALGWALPRLGIALAAIVVLPVIAYMLLVIAIVVGQAYSAFGQ